MIAPADLFELQGLSLAGVFAGLETAWEALDRIKDFTTEMVLGAGRTGALLRGGGEVMPRTVVLHHGRVFDSDFQLLGGDPTKGQMLVSLNGQEVSDAAVVYAGAVFLDDTVHIAPGAVVEPGTLFKGPTYIGPGSEVRQGAYLRGSCLVGAGCVVGHTTEMKNTIMLDGAKAGHFAYLGDSVLGRGVNLGAGTKLANLKIIDRSYRIKVEDKIYNVNRRKFGAIMGDGCETGCNSVTNPGTVLGKGCLVAPCVSVPAGYHKARSIIR
ncbi:MAG: glucose-1-phosphate thymidylyltransferase [Desulfarculus sp.]|jgi:bifunctional N-acetylglucosamine-1-phosphate-uridyltransferase/glucosamine-1-phosphate-acetyltransferase GlmU-like protein|nr:MAG: glucose-1-phosphate thymidylyltransferase [Desulfarculus sp.]